MGGEGEGEVCAEGGGGLFPGGQEAGGVAAGEGQGGEGGGVLGKGGLDCGKALDCLMGAGGSDRRVVFLADVVEGVVSAPFGEDEGMRGFDAVDFWDRASGCVQALEDGFFDPEEVVGLAEGGEYLVFGDEPEPVPDGDAKDAGVIGDRVDVRDWRAARQVGGDGAPDGVEDWVRVQFSVLFLGGDLPFAQGEEFGGL